MSQSLSFLPILIRKPSKLLVVLRNSFSAIRSAVEQLEVKASSAKGQRPIVAEIVLAEGVLEKEFAIARNELRLIDLLALIFIDAVVGARVLKFD